MSAAVITIPIRYSGSPRLLSVLGYLQLFYYCENAVMNVHPFQQPLWAASPALEDSKMMKRVLALEEMVV